jgi:hypothetical protein
MSNKKAIILLSGEDESAKALHALLYAMDLKDHGFQTKLFFDGAGTAWLRKFSEPNERLTQIFEQAEAAGVVEEACNSCAHGFKSVEGAQALNVKLSPEGSHISVGDLARDGYEIIAV